jgi:tetratricopeptide (TPR) repeat protein
MRQVFLFLLFCIWCTTTVFAQLEKAKESLKTGNLPEAKAFIDEVMKSTTAPKNADAWYTKAKVYVAIANDATVSKKYPAARMEAFEAFKKYVAVDDRMLISLQIDAYKPINDIYTGFYQEAANHFNSQQYAKAYEGFTNAIMVSSLMTEKGWISLKLDTNSVLYAAVAAEKLNRPADAVKYYSQLVDSKVKNDGFVEIYKWVANYYFETKQANLANRYLLIGKEIYPQDPFWASLELDMTREKGDKDALFATYEKTITGEPSNHLYRYNYAVELYQFAYDVDVTKRPANSEALIEKAILNISKAITIKPDYAKAQLFAGQIHYNRGVDILNKSKDIKGIAAEDVTAKANLKTAAIEKFDLAIPYLQKAGQLLNAQSALQAADKSDLKEAYDLLVTIYEQKGMKDKVAEYQNKFNDAEKKH